MLVGLAIFFQKYSLKRCVYFSDSHVTVKYGIVIVKMTSYFAKNLPSWNLPSWISRLFKNVRKSPKMEKILKFSKIQNLYDRNGSMTYYS